MNSPGLGELVQVTLAKPSVPIRQVVRGWSTRPRSKYLPHVGAKERAKLERRRCKEK